MNRYLLEIIEEPTEWHRVIAFYLGVISTVIMVAADDWGVAWWLANTALWMFMIACTHGTSGGRHE